MSDEDRFTELCRRYQHRVAGYALRRTGNAADAADITADVFLAAWRHIADVPDEDAALPWLFSTARRTLANHRRGDRRRSRLTTRLAQQLPEPAGTVERELPDLRAARDAFGSLSEPDRELLTLIGWEGLEHGRVAATLGCSRAALRVRLHRARRRFAAALAARGIDPTGMATDAQTPQGWAKEHATKERPA